MLEIWVFVNCKIYHIQLTLTDDVTKEISTQMTIYVIIDEPTASKSKVASLTVPSLQSPRDPVSFVISQQMGVSDGHTSQTRMAGWKCLTYCWGTAQLQHLRVSTKVPKIKATHGKAPAD